MRLGDYERILARQSGRRTVLQGTAAVGVAAAAMATRGARGATSAGSASANPPPAAMSADERALRKQILQTPGVGKGSPTDADWQKVGALCLGPTKARVQPNAFKGVQLTFMGLNNQNLHNFLFRGFLKPWEAYTGAHINWIDLAQADYNPRLQQAIATGTVDFDILEMGAPFEGDVCGKGLTSEMPEPVKQQLELADYVKYRQPPVGTWGDKIYCADIDGDTHNFNYRTDYFSDATLAKAWQQAGHKDPWGVPKTWQQVQAVTKFLKGKQINGQDAWGYLDAPKPWGGFGFYFLASRATAYVKHPDEKAWMFDVDTMKPRINNPGWVRAIQDEVDALPSEPPNQINADPNTTGFQQFLAGTGSMVTWWGDIGSAAKTSDTSVVGDISGYSILPGAEEVYNARAGKWEKLPSGPNYAPNLAYLGWGIYVMKRVDGDTQKHQAAWSAAAHLGGKDLAIWTAAYPSGFQCYRDSQNNIDEWVLAGYDRAYIANYLASQFDSYNHPNGAIEPRIPGIFQYYSLAEQELAKIFAGQVSAQAGADNIAAAWEKLTDQLGRSKQIAYYKTSLGL